jgi:hyperosmotically inducible periplasmic protein
MHSIQKVLVGSAIAAVFMLAGTAEAQVERPDSWVTLKTKLALMTADNVETSDLNVDTKDGAVTLHGKVASDAAKAKAEQVAKGIEGVKAVKNLLQVVPEETRDAVEDSDEVIKDNVEKALDADETLGDVTVASVNRGVVLLGGNVETLQAHVKAVETVSKVRGVRRVSSNITANKDTE